MESINDTKQHDSTQTQPLTQQQVRAIMMRHNGATYQDMSDSIKEPIDTIKNWFRKGTTISMVYKEYADAIVFEIGKKSLQRLKEMAGEATQTIFECMTSKDLPANIRLRTAMYVLDKVIPFTLQEKEDRAGALAIMMKFKGIDINNVMDTPTEYKRYKKVYDELSKDLFVGF